MNAAPATPVLSGVSTICKGLSTPFSSTTSGGTWSSSDATIASVDLNSGVVTGHSAGAATITYTVTTACGTASNNMQITVQDAGTISSISGSSALCIGSTLALNTNGTQGGTWGVTPATSGFASVDQNGVVSPIAKGTAIITYTFTGCGTYQATFAVTVNDIPDAGLTKWAIQNVPIGQVPPPAPVMCPGKSASLVNIGGMTGGYWSSDDPSIASVDANGQVTGVSAGYSTVSYNVSNSCGLSSAGVLVHVNSLPNAGAISCPSAVCAGASINLSASGDHGGTWSIDPSQSGIAIITSPGIIKGVGQGVATVVYTVGDPNLCGTSSATYQVTVNPLPDAGTLSNASVCAGLSTSLAINGSVGGTWQSSNTAVATVNPTTGLITGVAAGITNISYSVSTATCGSATASATVTVIPQPVAGPITGPIQVCVGSMITLSSTNNLSLNPSGGTATWSSSSSAATVDNT